MPAKRPASDAIRLAPSPIATGLWALAFVLAPAVQGQVSMLKGWQQRILATEDWKRINKQRSGGSR